MTDDHSPDERDEQLAARLEVPPLDDVTRRRLVTRALDDAGSRPAARPRLRRLLVPAAALVVLVLAAAGVLALVNRDGGDTTTSARPTAPDAVSPGGGEPAPGGSSSAESAAGVRDLGELGDVSDPGDLRRGVRDQLDEAPPRARATAPACLDVAVTGTPAPNAFGTGTYRGRPVLVLILPASGDRSTAVLLDTGSCRAVTVADLP
jgi:hypothetical protein